VQLDSWWYFKDVRDSGVDRWRPRPDAMPSGMTAAGLNATPLVLHNRFFSPHSAYLKQYHFLRGDDVAVPLDGAFWHDLLAGPAQEWGMATFEQDFLVTSFTKTPVLRSNLSAAATWLAQMDAAAQSLKVSIQYCMALPRFILQSSTMPAVLSARASEDYSPCGNAQWSYVPTNSILYDAVGLAPFKDVFWSTSQPQPGNHWADTCVERDPELNLLISTLSTATVAAGDRRGLANATRLRQSCTANGTLLKPDAPAVPLEGALLANFRDAGTLRQPALFPVHAASEPAGGAGQSHYVLSTSNQTKTIHVAPSDLGDVPDAVLLAADFYTVLRPPARADGGARAVQLRRVSRDSPLTIAPPRASPVGDATPFSYSVLVHAPPAGDGTWWVLLGEHAKLVSVARQRFSRIARMGGGLEATLTGAARERVVVLLLSGKGWSAEVRSPMVDGEMVAVECSLGECGVAKLVCAEQGCKCAARG
jgi:hypothetical protein